MISEIVGVLAEIMIGMNNTASVEEVAVKLSKNKKYDKNIIAADSWIYEKIVQEILDEEEGAGSEGFRFFSDEEVNLLGLENCNYLLHFFNIGLLTNNDVDSIIEKLFYFPENQITMDNINLLILALFMDIDNLSMPGSRLLLNSSDTIN